MMFRGMASLAFVPRGIAACMALTMTASPVSATVILCRDGPGGEDIIGDKHEIYFDVDPVKPARIWREGRWFDTQCGVTDGVKLNTFPKQKDWECVVNPNFYLLLEYTNKQRSDDSSLIEARIMYQIPRIDGKKYLKVYPNGPYGNLGRMYLTPSGTCTPSADPEASQPKPNF